MQLRFDSGFTSEDYVTHQGWCSARLLCCPAHPKGGCRFARHGTYPRVDPPGTLVARWYCPDAHQSFSLLPDHLAARFPGTLAQIETVVATVEQAPTLAAAVEILRPDDVTLPSALRWIHRRVRAVRAALTVVASLLPELCPGCEPTIASFRLRLACEPVLVPLRGMASAHLQGLPRTLGFRPPGSTAGGRKSAFQQGMGPDPPDSSP